MLLYIAIRTLGSSADITVMAEFQHPDPHSSQMKCLWGPPTGTMPMHSRNLRVALTHLLLSQFDNRHYHACWRSNLAAKIFFFLYYAPHKTNAVVIIRHSCV